MGGPHKGEVYSVRRRNGAGGRIRTPDLLITNQLHYQLCYASMLGPLPGSAHYTKNKPGWQGAASCRRTKASCRRTKADLGASGPQTPLCAARTIVRRGNEDGRQRPAPLVWPGGCPRAPSLAASRQFTLQKNALLRSLRE